MLTIGIDAIALTIAGTYLVNRLGYAPWLVLVIGLFMSVALYIINVTLIMHYIAKRSPKMASREKAFGDTELWECTAGLEIVPKWVSRLGLLSISSLLASLVFLAWSISNWVA